MADGGGVGGRRDRSVHWRGSSRSRLDRESREKRVLKSHNQNPLPPLIDCTPNSGRRRVAHRLACIAGEE
jgi:hypothetical protein